jgi:polysaccharide pyruvyl transferase WcaK-like protein
VAPRVLILEDRHQLRTTMVNLGDRAYHVGLHRLIRANTDCEISSGPVKAMPWFSSHHTRAVRTKGDARRLLELLAAWVVAVARESDRYRSHLLLARWVEDNALVRSPPFAWVDAAVRRRRARGLLETIHPYVFPALWATRLVRAIERADLVIFNGGAFIADHLDRYLPMVMLELYLAKRLGKPVMVVNQTVSVSRPQNRALVGLVYPLLDRHLIREPRSRKVLEGLGVDPARIVLSADAAFGLAADVPASPERERGPGSGVVGLCVRGDRPVRAEFWAEAVRILEEQFGKRVVFFFTSEYQDRAAFNRIARLRRVTAPDRFLDHEELIREIAGYDLVVTDRYHATIFAMLAGTPVVPIDSNTFKTRGLMDLAKYPLEVLPNDGDLDRLQAHMAHALEHRAELSAQVTAAAGRLAKLAARSIQALRPDWAPWPRPSSEA